MDIESEDAFEFYPCEIDGSPASIYVNLRFEGAEPSVDLDTRYSVEIAMVDRGPHGIGTAEEGEALNTCEESIIASAVHAGLVYVGRTRTRGEWEIVFYGPAGRAEPLQRAAACAKPRTTHVRDDYDPPWRYYKELLLPDAERKQWMDDRRLVELLTEQGDHAVRPRRVDHRASFSTEAARDAFVEAATRAGFTREPEPTLRESNVERRFAAQVFRSDPVELEHIHEVTMSLLDTAAKHGGVYDGWTAVPTRG